VTQLVESRIHSHYQSFSIKSFKDLYSHTDKQSANNSGSAAHSKVHWWESG